MLQLDDLKVGEIGGQFFQVVQGGATPAVNGLVVVAHCGEVASSLGCGAGGANQQFEQLVLGGVGVLVLVYQNMTQLPLPFAAHGLVLLQQLKGQANEVVKVHTLVGHQALFVARHDAGHQLRFIVLGLGQGLFGIQPHVFPQTDGPLPLSGGGGIGGAPGVFQDARDVVGVQN